MFSQKSGTKLLPGMIILVLFMIFSSGCSKVKNYFKNSPIAVPVKTKKLIYEKEADIKLDGKPWGIATDPETARIFIVSNEKECVYVVDLAQKEVSKVIKVGGSPWEAAFDKRRNRLYVTNGDEGTISVIDLETGEETLRVKTEKELPFDIAYCENRDEIYVTNSDSDCVSVIDGEKLTLKSNIECGDYPYSIGVDEISRKVYVSNNFDGTISIIDPQEEKEIKRLTPNSGVLMGLSVDNKNRRTLITAYETQQIIIVDNKKNEAVGAFNTLEKPIDVCTDENHQYIYSVHREASQVAVLSPEQQKYLRGIDVGKGPVRIAIDPIHNLIITVNNEGSSLSLIRYKVESSH